MCYRVSDRNLSIVFNSLIISGIPRNDWNYWMTENTFATQNLNIGWPTAGNSYKLYSDFLGF